MYQMVIKFIYCLLYQQVKWFDFSSENYPECFCRAYNEHIYLTYLGG